MLVGYEPVFSGLVFSKCCFNYSRINHITKCLSTFMKLFILIFLLRTYFRDQEVFFTHNTRTFSFLKRFLTLYLQIMHIDWIRLIYNILDNSCKFCENIHSEITTYRFKIRSTQYF